MGNYPLVAIKIKQIITINNCGYRVTEIMGPYKRANIESNVRRDEGLELFVQLTY